MMWKRIKVRSYQKGLLFRDGEFSGLLETGRQWLFDPLWKLRVDIVDLRDPWLRHSDLDLIVKSAALGEQAEALDLLDHQRGLVWIDGRFVFSSRC